MSEFRFACPHCGQRISGDTSYQGTQITCPACQKTLSVPSPATRAAIARPPASDQTGGGKISALALISFVSSFGLSAGSIPGIVCGHLAKARLRRDPSLAGKSLATAGLILSYSFLFLTLALVASGFTVFAPAHGRQLTQKEQGTRTPALLAQRLVDEVKVGEFTSEFEHRMESRFSGSGQYMDKPVRNAVNGGFISYVMKVDPAQPMVLCCTYWGGDTGGRRFDVLVNEKIIATQTLDFNDPGRFFEVEYAISQDLTRGQSNVTVVFQGYPGRTVGGIFGCQMLKR